MNAIKSDFMPGVRGLYALASRAPGTYKVGPGRAFRGGAFQLGLFK